MGGASAVDVPRLNLGRIWEAEEFLECYGFSWDDPAHRREMEAIRAEAVGFLEEVLLRDEQGLHLPAAVKVQTDVRRLLLWASEEPGGSRQRWTCALLRVMHTVAHARSSLEERYGRQIRAQILGRFQPHLHKRPDGLVLGSGPNAVPLARFEVKASKRLLSVVMKLLHKVENVAAEVFDRIGVRFVTRHRFDALLVARYLRANNVIMFANVNPARCRNTLIDIAWVQGEVERVAAEVRAGRISEQDGLEAMRRRTREQPYPTSALPPQNPFTSVDYRAIQFTCRQQIRIPAGRLGAQGGLPGPEGGGEEAGGDLHFFFPYEVQILDEESYEISRSGMAGHDLYKRRQMDVVKRRVLGPLLPEAG